MSEYATLDATALRAELAGGARTVRAIVEEALARAESHGAELGAFLWVDRDGALERADRLDAARARGEPAGPLFGVPVALKANLCLEGAPASCGSRILEGWTAPYTATAVQRLLDAGAVPVGVANMDEFAMGSSGENSSAFPSRNPWDPARVPGGSSSGSTVAVAAGIVPLALGSDTGGSVRQPAALCGVSGHKPTYGRVSRYGLVAFGSSLDQVSPVARSARDLELAMSVVSGADELDSTCIPLPPTEPSPGKDTLEGLRIGVPKEYLPPELDAGIAARVEEAICALEAVGAVRVEVELPHTAHAVPTYYVVATAEASANLARFDGVRYGARADGDGSLQGMIAATRGAGFGEEVKRRILLGTYVLSSGYHEAWYDRALRVRRLLKRDFDAAFADVDVLVGPTSPTAAFPIGERADDPVAMYLADVMTVPASLAGLPAASVPCGFVEEGGSRLPVGLQVIGPALEDARVLRVARAFQAATDHHREAPPRALEGAGEGSR